MSTTTTPTQQNTHDFLNSAQLSCLENYNNGEFSYLIEAETKKVFEYSMEQCGDGLLQFLMIELSTAEDCESPHDALARIQSAINQLNEVCDGLGKLVDIEGAKSSSNQSNLADDEFESYDFGEGATVAGFSGWNKDDPRDYTRMVYLSHEDSAPEADTERVSFHVRFDIDGNVDEVYGLEMRNGNQIGVRGIDRNSDINREAARTRA